MSDSILIPVNPKILQNINIFTQQAKGFHQKFKQAEAQAQLLIQTVIDTTEHSGKEIDVKKIDDKGFHITLRGGDPSSGPETDKDIIPINKDG